MNIPLSRQNNLTLGFPTNQKVGLTKKIYFMEYQTSTSCAVEINYFKEDHLNADQIVYKLLVMTLKQGTSQQS